MLEREAALEAVKRQLEELCEEEQKQQSKRMDLTHEMEKYGGKIKENSSKIRHFTAEVSVFPSNCCAKEMLCLSVAAEMLSTWPSLSLLPGVSA